MTNRATVLDSYREGLLDIEDLYNLKILTFDQAATLRHQPPRGVAWLLNHVKDRPSCPNSVNYSPNR